MSALALVEPLQAFPADHGRFRWHVRLGTTFWSPSVYRLHGYQPGAVVPSVDLALGHKHPDDLLGCVDVLHESMLTNRVIVHEHRIVTTNREVRQVLMVARPIVDELGSAEQLCGFLVPVHEDESKVDQAALSTTSPRSCLPATFAISDNAVRALMMAQRPTSPWRNPPQRPRDGVTTASGSEQRRDLEDRMFPLEHLILGTIRMPL